MRFQIDPSIHSLFPTLRVAVIRISLASEATASSPTVEQLKSSALQHLLDRVVPFGTMKEFEEVASVRDWLNAFRSMGLNPKKKQIRPTHYAFGMRLIKQKQWPTSIGPLVDTYLANQVRHLLPHGGFDVSRLSGGTVRLSQHKQTYQFQRLGNASTDADMFEDTTPGEVLYLDCVGADTAPRVLTRYFNYRDADYTKIVDEANETESTKDFILFVESLDSTEAGITLLQAAADDLLKAYTEVYGAGLKSSYIRIASMTGSGAELNLDW